MSHNASTLMEEQMEQFGGMDKVKSFIREVLGCNCPEEVFRSIETHTGRVLNNSRTPLRLTINVGGRLLIYILDTASISDIQTTLPDALKQGVTERDHLKFNRFRLVIATDNIKTTEHEARALTGLSEGASLLDLSATDGLDSKVHLHILEKSSLTI